jgi:agmatine deiminase
MNPSLKLPAEYEPQRAVWLTWPGNPDTWPDTREAAESAYAHFVATISQHQPVELICPPQCRTTAQKRLTDAKADPNTLTFHAWPANDAWCRDHGPLFVRNAKNSLELVDFTYNAWGGKFPPWDCDDDIPRRVSELRNLPRHRLPTVGEGGALEINRSGLLITTESVWLNDNRNPGLQKSEAEALFRQYLGATQTLWLPEGLIGDDTDGHIDTLTRFVDDDTVVTVIPNETDDNYAVLKQNAEILSEHVNVVALPHPDPIRPEKWREEVLPATYANFLILNDIVLVPTYNQPKNDRQALGILDDLFNTRTVIGIPCEDLILEGGALHCLSMQEPR